MSFYYLAILLTIYATSSSRSCTGPSVMPSIHHLHYRQKPGELTSRCSWAGLKHWVTLAVNKLFESEFERLRIKGRTSSCVALMSTCSPIRSNKINKSIHHNHIIGSLDRIGVVKQTFLTQS